LAKVLFGMVHTDRLLALQEDVLSMKFPLLALAALASTASVASAQSSVTVFGIVDLSVRSTKNGDVGSLYSVTSGNNATSRWGIRGTEDLGDGNAAQFWLESNLSTDTGVAGSSTYVGQLFDRRSTLGLINQKYGEVRIGRDYVPTHVAACGFDVYGCVGVGNAKQFDGNATSAIFTAFGSTSANQNTLSRANNAVQYILPDKLGGVSGGIFYSAGEGAATTAGGGSKTRGLRLGYGQGPFQVNFASVVTSNTLVAGASFKDQVLGASYDFGMLKVVGYQRNYKIASEKFALTMLGVSAPVPGGVFRASYLRGNQTSAQVGVSSNDAFEVSMGYQYDLSKRTALYTTVGQLSNKGNATYTIPGGPAVTANNYGGQRSSAYEFGVRHTF
jgi:predicted porin